MIQKPGLKRSEEKQYLSSGVRTRSKQEFDLRVGERKSATEAAAGNMWKHFSCARHGIKCST